MHKITSSGIFFNRNSFLYVAAIAGLLTFSAFTTKPANTASSQAHKSISPDSLGLIDEQMKEELLAEIRRNRYTDSLVNLALGLKGKPYRWGGKSLKGFDCSGFVYYIFEKFGYDMERSSRLQSSQGTEIALENVQKGDLLFFTGTNPQQKQVGHVGIVISEKGNEVAFVHSSSNGGVKVSELKGYYESRILFAKRLQSGR